MYEKKPTGRYWGQRERKKKVPYKRLGIMLTSDSSIAMLRF
jgi:hypothetical protein